MENKRNGNKRMERRACNRKKKDMFNWSWKKEARGEKGEGIKKVKKMHCLNI